MNDYVIFTDSGCDLSAEVLREWNVSCVELTFCFGGSKKMLRCSEMTSDRFYKHMRRGENAKTSAANVDDFMQAFEPVLNQGKDILYIGFSSGLSATCGSAQIAAQLLAKRYPQQRICVIDTLAASAGQGLLVYLAMLKRKNGISLSNNEEYIRTIAPKLSHWFTVDDLEYLKRGGRVSPTVALVGGVLGIKPVMHVDDEGHLVKVSTVRGRKASIMKLADKYGELAEEPANGTVFISQADCSDDAQILAEELKQRYGVSVKLIADIGPIIGAHSGPGTIALFFIGKER